MAPARIMRASEEHVHDLFLSICPLSLEDVYPCLEKSKREQNDQENNNTEEVLD